MECTKEKFNCFIDAVIEKGEITEFWARATVAMLGTDPIYNIEPILALAKDPDNTVGNIHYKSDGKFEHWFMTDVKPSSIMLSFAHLSNYRGRFNYALNKVEGDGDIPYEDEILLQYSGGVTEFLPFELVGFCERFADKNQVVRRVKETFPNWDLVFKIKIPDEVCDIMINEINNAIKADLEFNERTKKMKGELWL